MKTTCTATFGEDGILEITGAKTLEKYQQLKYENHAPMEGCFFAFNKQQYEEGYEEIKHLLSEGEKIVSVGDTGLFGKRECVDRYFDFYDNKNKLIREQCDPQEVYYYEWNNHEICYANDDEEAIKIIIDIWGEEVAKTIKRIYAAQTVNKYNGSRQTSASVSIVRQTIQNGQKVCQYDRLLRRQETIPLLQRITTKSCARHE